MYLMHTPPLAVPATTSTSIGYPCRGSVAFQTPRPVWGGDGAVAKHNQIIPLYAKLRGLCYIFP